jgi:diacylglycerol kinase family enzyme
LWEDVEAFQVSSPSPVEVQADGELLAAVTELSVTFQPDSLTVAVSTAG